MKHGVGRVSASARSFLRMVILYWRTAIPAVPRLSLASSWTTRTRRRSAKLIRDAKERRSPVGIIVAREESQLRQLDRERRWGQEDGVWVLRTTRHWLPRDLEVLKPLFERMRTEGANFLQKNSALAEELRRTFVDLDEVEKHLKKAAQAIDAVSGL